MQAPFGQDDEQGAGDPGGQGGQQLDKREQPEQPVTKEQAAAVQDTAGPRAGNGRWRGVSSRRRARVNAEAAKVAALK